MDRIFHNGDEFPRVRNHVLCENGRRHGRSTGLIRLYILHSLTEGQKSGYDLIKEISEKTYGLWVPSKGTLYPMLKKMEEEGLIKVSGTGTRSKTIYEITAGGRESLERIIEHRKGTEQRMYVFRKLLFEIFGGNPEGAREMLFDIRHTLGEIPPDKEKEAVAVIKRCLEDLRRLSKDESGDC